MRWRSSLRRMSLVAALVTVLLVGVAPATADAAAPWCDKMLWSSTKVETAVLGGRFEKLIKIMEEVDHVTDLATIALAVISGGVAAPALVGKFVAKLGKHRIVGVLKKLGKDLAKVNKRKAGVRISVKCLAGIAPYPSFGVYT